MDDVGGDIVSGIDSGECSEKVMDKYLWEVR